MLPADVTRALFRLPLRRLDLQDVSLAPQESSMLELGPVELDAYSSSSSSSSSSNSSASSTGGGTSSSSSNGMQPLLTRLQELKQHCGDRADAAPVLAPSLLPQLRVLTSLSWNLRCQGKPPDVLGRLTQLKHLVLGWHVYKGWDWSGLTQLTHLALVDTLVHEGNLLALGPGSRFQHLEALLLPTSVYVRLPLCTGLTALDIGLSHRDDASCSSVFG
jgi:hypothetical protein